MLKIILTLFAALYASLAMAAIDVNTATATDLDTIKGIGPKMAASILDERKKNGNFKDWADFAARVKGVGEKNSAKFSEAGLIVAGKPLSGPAPQAAAAPAKAKPAAATPAAQPAAARKPASAAAK